MGNKHSSEVWEAERAVRYSAATRHLPPPHLLPPPPLPTSRGGGGPRPRSASHQPEPHSETLHHSPPSSADSPTSPHPQNQPQKPSRPGTSDSGYFTGLDSDPRRAKARGSRLSLNDAAVFSEASSNAGSHHYRRGPPPPFLLTPPPHFHGGPHPPPHFLGGPPPPHLFLPPQLLIPPPPPPPQLPKGKKGWRKRGKKGRRSEDGSQRSGSLPPFLDLPHMGFRAQSMDNLHAHVLQAPLPPPLFAAAVPPANLHGRSLRPFASQLDLRGPIISSPVSTPTPKRGRKGSAKTSVSGGSDSRRSREPTHFEEERPPVEEEARPSKRASLAGGERLRGLYDALPELPKVEEAKVAAKEPQKSRAEVHSPPEERSDEAKPLTISSEAAEMRLRNAKVLERAESPPPPPPPVKKEEETPPAAKAVREESVEEAEIAEAMEKLRASWAGNGGAESERAATLGERGGRGSSGLEDPLYAQLPPPQAPDPDAFRRQWSAALPPETGTARVRHWAAQHSRDFARSKPDSEPPPSEATPYESSASLAASIPAKAPPTLPDSEIDFSWVLDLESKFKRGEEDPEEEEEGSADWKGYTPQHRNSFTRSFGSQKDLSEKGESASHQPKARYFGMESSNYGVLGNPKPPPPQTQRVTPLRPVTTEPPIRSNVRGKAALFEKEAARMNGRPAAAAAAQARLRQNGRAQQARPASSYHPASSGSGGEQTSSSPSSRGPSERKIHQGRREGWIQSPDASAASSAQSTNANVVRNPRAGRNFEATEFYRKHYQAQRAHGSRMDGYRPPYTSQPSLLHHSANLPPCRPITAEWH